ncbi:MAG TPA: Uma2 family endonuclease [Pyrinomonadaceae bacterium]|jgi:Uma2 family endonuclease
MVFPKTKFVYTIENYLKIDRSEDERYEYLDGEIYLMAGESDAHGIICFNLAGLLYEQLKGSNCQGRIKDTKIRSGSLPQKPRSTKGMFSYPDVVVICGEPQYLDEHRDVILNPSVIFEVLSESIEQFDRGEKFLRYGNWNPTLTDYVLVSQNKALVEHYIRQSDGGWTLYRYSGLAADFTVETINCRFKLTDIFDRVEFPPEIED